MIVCGRKNGHLQWLPWPSSGYILINSLLLEDCKTHFVTQMNFYHTNHLFLILYLFIIIYSVNIHIRFNKFIVLKNFLFVLQLLTLLN